MSLDKKQDFQCQKCGNCCRPHGYVRLAENETELIAGYQGMDVLQFVKECTRLTNDRTGLSLTESEDGACIFLAQDNTCIIEDVKPQQCRDFPAKWSYAGAEILCPGLAKAAGGG
jgi:Fe-S-cluster containining protein